MVKSCPRPAASTHHHGITPPARTTTASRRRHAPDQIRRSQPSTREDRSVVLQIGGHPMEGGGSLHDLHESRKTSPCRMSSQMILCFISISAPLP
ncbi:uncharacterized protein [Lolium perenne]|uniref:uncharacterized protein isoform X6 n=1 Tax=Lolium perenne TaxID=4522 RepID=UPI003A99A9C0